MVTCRPTASSRGRPLRDACAGTTLHPSIPPSLHPSIPPSLHPSLYPSIPPPLHPIRFRRFTLHPSASLRTLCTLVHICTLPALDGRRSAWRDPVAVAGSCRRGGILPPWRDPWHVWWMCGLMAVALHASHREAHLTHGIRERSQSAMRACPRKRA